MRCLGPLQIFGFLILAHTTATIPQAATAAEVEYYLVGNDADARPAKTQGGLVLLGGGGSARGALRWFIEQAGGGDIVVLKAGEEDGVGKFFYEDVGGCDSVEVLVFSGRAGASDPKVIEVLNKADGIYLAGGKQHLYADYWKGTPVAQAVDAHVKAGKPVAGSSAGLAVLGQVAYTAHISGRVTSDIALSNPYDERLTFERDFLHFDLLRGVVTDSHLSARNRLGRLVTFVARHAADEQFPRAVGIGVDEKTALCVAADGRGQVFSESDDGGVWFVIPPENCPVPEPGKPLRCEGYRIVVAGPKSAVDLRGRAIQNPVKVWAAAVEDGVLKVEPTVDP